MDLAKAYIMRARELRVLSTLYACIAMGHWWAMTNVKLTRRGPRISRITVQRTTLFLKIEQMQAKVGM